MTLHDELREHIMKKVEPDFLYQQLQKSEWSPFFERAMRNRLIMGYFRYGPLKTPNFSTEARMGTIQRKVKRYLHTGNDELLIDIANIAMKEFVAGQHPSKHFKAEDNTDHIGE